VEIGVRAIDFGSVNGCDELLKRFDEKGVKVTQLPLGKVFADFPPVLNDVSIQYVKDVNKKFMAKNVAIDVLGCYINLANPNKTVLAAELNKFRDHIEYASILNARFVGTETGSLNEDYSFHAYNHSEEAYRSVLSNLEALVEGAENKGVCIGVEAVQQYVIHSPQSTYRLLKDLASLNVSVIFDPVNLLTAENYQKQLDIYNEAFFLFADKIKVFHLKDFIIDDNKTGVPLGEGMFLWKEFLKLAKEYKVEANILLEGTTMDGYTNARKLLKDYLY
jgi:L-ribulose-5-phosphate 3-epimerase